MLRQKGSQKTKLCRDKGFVYRDIAGEVLEEECCDILFSVETLIKGNGSGTLSRPFITLSLHKERKMAEKLCRNKRQLCRDTKFKVSIERQEDFVMIEKFYVVTNTT